MGAVFTQDAESFLDFVFGKEKRNNIGKKLYFFVWSTLFILYFKKIPLFLSSLFQFSNVW